MRQTFLRNELPATAKIFIFNDAKATLKELIKTEEKLIFVKNRIKEINDNNNM